VGRPVEGPGAELLGEGGEPGELGSAQGELVPVFGQEYGPNALGFRPRQRVLVGLYRSRECRGAGLEARAAWWGRAGDAAPSVLDVLDMSEVPDRLETGGRLLQAGLGQILAPGSSPPEVHPVLSGLG